MELHAQILSPLFSILENIGPVSNELKKALSDKFEEQKILKGKTLLSEGEVCKSLWFLSAGLLRSYHDIGEKEITSRIMFTNHIVISAGSFFTQTPATESIEVLADTTVARLSFSDLQDIYKSFPSFNYHTRIITEQYFAQQEQRLYMLRKHDALSKYRYFLEHYAAFLQDIPQKYIASFLDMTPETLSRTRSRMRNK
ncbi:MAG: Crp/Fnr family transcriptional regulator [Ferruginibacter sp.]